MTCFVQLLNTTAGKSVDFLSTRLAVDIKAKQSVSVTNTIIAFTCIDAMFESLFSVVICGAGCKKKQHDACDITILIVF